VGELQRLKIRGGGTQFPLVPPYFDHWAWRYASVVHVYAVVVCLSLCVCLSHSGIVSKWLNPGSQKQSHTIARELLSFLIPKSTANLVGLGHPHKCRWDGSNGQFWQIPAYNSKMVQNRCIVSIKVEKELICALFNGYVADDLGWPITHKPPQFLHFSSPLISL